MRQTMLVALLLGVALPSAGCKDAPSTAPAAKPTAAASATTPDRSPRWSTQQPLATLPAGSVVSSRFVGADGAVSGRSAPTVDDTSLVLYVAPEGVSASTADAPRSDVETAAREIVADGLRRMRRLGVAQNHAPSFVVVIGVHPEAPWRHVVAAVHGAQAGGAAWIQLAMRLGGDEPGGQRFTVLNVAVALPGEDATPVTLGSDTPWREALPAVMHALQAAKPLHFGLAP
jgi:hypothetical protein